MILLTGASGFVGSRILDLLKARCAGPVIALGRRSAPGITVCDLLANDVLDIPWSGVDRVIHCAAVLPARSASDPFDNVRMTQALLNRLSPASLKAMLLLSSVAVYPLGQHLEDVILQEDQEPAPKTPYGRAKLTQEWLMRNFTIGRGPLAVLRPSSIYGQGNTSRTMLPIFVEQARAGLPITLTGSRHFVQNFIHVDDVVEIAVRAVLEDRNGAFNLFSNETLTPLQLARKVIDRFGGKSQIVDARDNSPYPCVSFDNRRMIETFSFKPTSLDQGLASLA